MTKAVVSPRLAAGAKVSLAARLRFMSVLSLSEREVGEFVGRLERDGLFRRLLGLEGAGWRVIRRKRYARTRWTAGAFDMDESRLRDARPADPPMSLTEDPELLPLLERLGREKFERYFVLPDEPLTDEQAAEACGLTAGEVRRLADFALELCVRAEFFAPGAAAAAPAAASCLGEVYGDGEDYGIAYFSPHLARGRYEVDYDAWRRMREDGRLSVADARAGADLLRQAEMLNMRSDNLQRLVREGLETQGAFLAGGDREKLRTLSLRETARRLNVASSTACRLVAGRSVRLPWKEEVPLAALFPQKKEVLREILEAREDELAGKTDSIVQKLLSESYQLRVPRRTVNYWRRKLGAPEATE